MKAKVFAHIVTAAEATARIAHQYKDLERQTKEGSREFDVLIYLVGVTRAEQVRLVEASKAEISRLKVPPSADIALVCPRGSSGLYGKAHAVSAEAAVSQVMTVLREVLNIADVTVDEMRAEVALAAPCKEQAGG